MYGIQGQALEVNVVGGRNLKNTEWLSRQDPYVVIEYATQKFRTKTDTDGGKNPSFNDKFTISLIEGLRELNVHVWNSNSVTLDDHIGTGRVQLEKVLSSGYDDNSWTLISKSGKHAGELRLIMHFNSKGLKGDLKHGKAHEMPGGYGYPPAQAGYPEQHYGSGAPAGYPQQQHQPGGYPPHAGGYPPSGYPPAAPGYGTGAPGYPPAPGYGGSSSSYYQHDHQKPAAIPYATPGSHHAAPLVAPAGYPLAAAAAAGVLPHDKLHGKPGKHGSYEHSGAHAGTGYGHGHYSHGKHKKHKHGKMKTKGWKGFKKIFK